ncbi:MAG: hypothetical protein ACYC5F_10110 [Thermoleophilia bacterium]
MSAHSERNVDHSLKRAVPELVAADRRVDGLDDIRELDEFDGAIEGASSVSEELPKMSEPMRVRSMQ